MAGCQVAGPEIVGAPVETEPPGEILLAGDGIKLAGTSLEIGFGRTQASTIPAVSKLVGRTPPVGQPPLVVPDCGTVVSWNSGLSLTFIAGDFRGWSARGGPYPAALEGTRTLPDGQLAAGRVCART